MYYVYHGYVSCDNCDASERPCYELSGPMDEESVVELKNEFEEELHDGCSNAIFRVITGREMQLKPKEVVVNYELS